MRWVHAGKASVMRSEPEPERHLLDAVKQVRPHSAIVTRMGLARASAAQGRLPARLHNPTAATLEPAVA